MLSAVFFYMDCSGGERNLYSLSLEFLVGGRNDLILYVKSILEIMNPKDQPEVKGEVSHFHKIDSGKRVFKNSLYLINTGKEDLFCLLYILSLIHI